MPLMQAKCLSEIGYRVTLITLSTAQKSDLFSDFLKNNRKINFISAPNPIKGIERMTLSHELGHRLYFSLGRWISSYLNQNHFDIIITHYAPAAIAIPKSIKQLLVLHGVPKKRQIADEVALRVADKLIAVSESVAKGWEEVSGIKNITVIHNGIDEKRFSPKNKDEKKLEDIDVLYVGRLIKIKGLQFLIPAINFLRKEERFSKVRVVIGGAGPFLKEIKFLIKQYNLYKNIKLIGYIKNEELPNYYQRSKLCVFPSYKKEGVLTTMLEAASTQKAIITSDCCGMKDFVINGMNGILVKPKDSHSLYKNIRKLLINQELRYKLGFNARKTILQKWTWKHSIKKLEKVLIEVSSEKNENRR